MRSGDVVTLFTLLFLVLQTLDVGAASRVRCRKVRLRKGRSRMLLRRTMIKYSCKSGYMLVGSKRAICVSGQWNRQPPVCVAAGCPAVVGIGKLRVTQTFDGAVLSFSCDESHALEGMRNIYCDGKLWSAKPPTCIPVGSESVCDFEKHLCGWTNSDQDHFDWTVWSGKTPTRYTGPSWDHTYGDGLNAGHYLFIETSNPRQPGDMALLWSPVYPSTYAGKCFQFWYYMSGRVAVGSLSVFVKPKDQTFSEQTPLFTLTGNQGDEWKVGHVKIPLLAEEFQVIIRGEKNQSVYSDIAIDDVSVLLCPEPETTSTATTATSTSVYVMSQEENQTTTQTAIEQDTSPGQTTLTSALSTEHMSTESTVERSTTEADTSTHDDTIGFTTEPTTTRHLFTVIYDDTVSNAEQSSTAGDVTTWRTTETERSSTAGRTIDQTSDQYKFIVISTMYNEPETTAEVLVDVTTGQMEDVVHSTTARKSAATDTEAIAHNKEVMSTTEQSVPRTARHTTRSEPLVTDTTQHLADMTLLTDGEQLTTHTEHITPLPHKATHTKQHVTLNTPRLQQGEEVSFRSQATTDDVIMTTRHSVSSKQTYTQAETPVTVLGVFDPTTTESSTTPQRKPAYTTTAEYVVAVKTSHTVLVNTRISDETTLSGVVDGPSIKADTATTERALPVLRYKHRKITHDIPLISSLLALAALLSIAIGVVMWVVVSRRERARQQDQELTPIATAYNY